MNNQSAVLLSLLLLPWTAQAQARPPVIDMHLHAYSEAQWTGRPRNPGR